MQRPEGRRIPIVAVDDGRHPGQLSKSHGLQICRFCVPEVVIGDISEEHDAQSLRLKEMPQKYCKDRLQMTSAMDCSIASQDRFKHHLQPARSCKAPAGWLGPSLQFLLHATREAWWHHGGYMKYMKLRQPYQTPQGPLAGLDRQEEYGHCAVVNFVDPGFVIESQKLSEIFLQILQITKQMSLPFSDFCVSCHGHILFLRMMCQQLFQQAGEAWVILGTFLLFAEVFSFWPNSSMVEKY